MVLEEERRQQGIDSMILEAVTGPPEQVAPCIRNALEVSEASVTPTEPCMMYRGGLLGWHIDLLNAHSALVSFQRNWEQALPGSLAAFQQRRKEEIERVCSRYYAEFLG